MKVYKNYVSIDTVELSAGWFDWIDPHDPLTERERTGLGKYHADYIRKKYKPGVEKIFFKDIRTIRFHEGKTGYPTAEKPGCIKIKSERSRDSKFIYFMGDAMKVWWEIAQHLGKIAGLNAEKNHDESRAIMIFEEFSLHGEAKRLRKKMRDEGRVKVDQTVIHGDYVDDRDTIIKDSVVSKSSIGAGGKSKAEELREAKALLDDGIIDDDEFKQMKKEILGK